MTVDLGLARKAIQEKVANPLGMDVMEAARAIRKIIDHSMSDAISEGFRPAGGGPEKIYPRRCRRRRAGSHG